MKEYIQPDIKKTVAEEPVMAALSLHDKVGYEQLGNETSFDSEGQEHPQSHNNVWE